MWMVTATNDIPGVGGVWPGDVCGSGDNLLQEQGGGPSQANILAIPHFTNNPIANVVDPAPEAIPISFALSIKTFLEHVDLSMASFTSVDSSQAPLHILDSSF